MYSGKTVPFASALQLSTHFLKHGKKFGAASEQEYEQMADAFMSKPIRAGLFECTSVHGRCERNRIEESTLYFGVAYNGSTIATFFPHSALTVKSKGGSQGFILSKCVV